MGCPLFVSKIAELRQLWSTLAQISNSENLKEGSIQSRRLLEIEPVAVEIKAQNGPQPCLSQQRRVFEDSYRQPNKLQSSKARAANDIQRRLCNVVNKAIPCFDDAQRPSTRALFHVCGGIITAIRRCLSYDRPQAELRQNLNRQHKTFFPLKDQRLLLRLVLWYRRIDCGRNEEGR